MKNPIPLHNKLQNRYHFSGVFELVTPLRISSGQASIETDAPFMRNFDGVPYIPGSSLRGAIRSEVERMLSAVGEKIGLTSCILFEKGCCAENARAFLQGVKDDEKIIEFASNELCDVCRLFGSTVYASRLIIEDALPEKEDMAKNRLCIRDCVGIDRDTGAAKDGAKFDYEVIEPEADGPLFRFRMTAENVSESDRKLINLILTLLQTGFCVGGKRAGGLGKIKLAGKILKTGFVTPAEAWEMIIQNKDINACEVSWKEGF